MKRYEVLISDEAQQNIGAAFYYIHERSPANAERWLAGLYDAVNSLETMPARFGDAREAARHRLPLKQLIYKNYRIIYWIKDETVEIISVRHAKRRTMPRRNLPDNLL